MFNRRGSSLLCEWDFKLIVKFIVVAYTALLLHLLTFGLWLLEWMIKLYVMPKKKMVVVFYNDLEEVVHATQPGIT